jgi:hypothetical protein
MWYLNKNKEGDRGGLSNYFGELDEVHSREESRYHIRKMFSLRRKPGPPSLFLLLFPLSSSFTVNRLFSSPLPSLTITAAFKFGSAQDDGRLMDIYLKRPHM